MPSSHTLFGTRWASLKTVVLSTLAQSLRLRANQPDLATHLLNDFRQFQGSFIAVSKQLGAAQCIAELDDVLSCRALLTSDHQRHGKNRESYKSLNCNYLGPLRASRIEISRNELGTNVITKNTIDRVCSIIADDYAAFRLRPVCSV